MADLFFVHDDGDDQRTSMGHPVAIEQARSVAARFGTKYAPDGPAINPGAPLGTKFQRVVLQVHEHDVGALFDRAGYYTITGLSPDEARTIFGIYHIHDD